jgi:drug/metabolite transporter (DMT)-like permease
MSAERSQLDGFAIGMMTFLCAIWGIQQVVIKLAAHDMLPVVQVGLRSVISAVLVAVVMKAKEIPFFADDGTWKPGVWIGLLFGIEFLTIGEGLHYTSASHMVVFLYTAPIFAALGLQVFLPSERLNAFQWTGIALAFTGIGISFLGGGRGHGGYPHMIWGDLLGLTAGAAWGFTTVVIRSSSLSEAPATKTLLYQLLGAVLLVNGVAFSTGNPATIRMTPLVWASLLFQAVVVSFASYLMWFRLLRSYLASRLGVFSFMTPLFGVIFGVLLLHESVDAAFAIGSALVLAGIIAVSGIHRLLFRPRPE